MEYLRREILPTAVAAMQPVCSLHLNPLHPHPIAVAGWRRGLLNRNRIRSREGILESLVERIVLARALVASAIAFMRFWFRHGTGCDHKPIPALWTFAAAGAKWISRPLKGRLWFLGLTIFVKNKMKCSFRLFNISGKRNIRGLESELYRHFIDIEVFNDNVITANAQFV